MTTNRKAGEGMAERVTRAAYDCFEKYGLSKTTIDDIASRAQISRPSIYKYFTGKDDIIDHICRSEATKLNLEVQERLLNISGLDKRLTEAMLHVARVARENPYIDRVLRDIAFQASPADSSSAVYQIQCALWRPFAEQAAGSGEPASEAMLSWIHFSQGMLLTRLDTRKLTDDELRYLIRRFIVDPLLPPPYPRASSGGFTMMSKDKM